MSINLSLCTEYLAARGITDETVKLYSWECVEVCGFSVETVKERLGRKLPKGVNEVIWFPITDKDGAIICWIARILPNIDDEPKFICAVGSGGPPFIARATYKLKNGRPVIVTESPVKAAVCLQAGFDAIGLNGVWCASVENSNGYVVMRADLQEALEWRGRQVYLGFDADWTVNHKVRQAMFRLFFVLSVQGAEVFQLCTWDLAEGKGIDDYLVNQFRSNGQHSPQETLRGLITSATPFIDSIQATPLDLGLVKTELQHVLIPKALREQLAKPLAKRLGVKTETLRKIIATRRKPKSEPNAADASQAESQQAEKLPLIEMPEDNRYISEFALKLAEILAPHEVFRRFDRCVVPRKDEKDRVSLAEVDAQEFRTLIEGYCSPYYWRKDSAGNHVEMVRHSLSTENARATLVNRKLLEGIRPIHAFNRISLPVIDPDGKLRLLPKGYDDASKIYTAANAIDYPLDMHIFAAKKLFKDLLSEFPFLPGDAGRATSVLVASALTLYTRHLLSADSIRPNFLVSANAEGSGKTLLCKIPIIAIQGVAPAGTVPKDEAEMRKLIGGIALSGSPVFFLDNVKGHLNSSSLEALTTSPTTEFRLLGQNKVIDAEHGLTVFITCNDATFSGDLRRRTLMIELFTADSRPENRPIKSPLDDAKLIEKRPEILGALWAFTRYWDEEGRPKPKYINQSFPNWSEIIGGILEACSYAVPTPSPIGASGGDRQLIEMEKLVENLVIGTEYTFNNLVEKAREHRLFERIIGDEDELDREARSKFSLLLRRFTDRTFSTQCDNETDEPIIVKFKLSGTTARKKYLIEQVK
jgi:hypothetical protein